MTSIKKPLCTKLATAVAAALASTATMAEQSGLEEIVVTAQKRAQAISEVPLAIQALSEEQLEVRGFVETSDIIKSVPGASFSQSLSPTGSSASIRGIATNSGAEPTVAYYLDETPFSVPGQSVSPSSSLFDLERVEVLRSPQGTLYGQSSMGGTIRLISRDPDLSEGFGGKIKIGTATVDGGETGGSGDIALNIPLIEDKLAGRLVVSYQDLGGWLESNDFPDANGGDDINGSEFTNVRAKLLYKATDDLSVKFSYRHHTSDVDFGNITTTPGERVYNGTAGIPTFQNTDYDVVALTFDYDLGFASLTSTTNYIDWEYDAQFAFTAGFPLRGLGGYESDGLAHETRLVSNNEGPFQWVTGVYYRDASTVFASDLEAPIGNQFPLDETTVDSKVWSVFGEASYELFDGFAEVLVGLRYFEDEKEREQIVGIVAQPEIDDKTSDINPRFNLTLNPTENGMVFLNIAKGYRSTMFNSSTAIALAPPAFGDVSSTDSDSLWTYELGTRWTFLDGILSAELVAYYTDWEDAVFSIDPAGFGIPTAVNIGDAELKGLDFVFAWSTPIDGLTLSVSGNVNDSTWDSVNPNVTAAAPTIVNGSDLPSVPERSFYWTADYSRPIADNLEFFLFGSWADRSDQLDINLLGSDIDDLDDVSVRLGVRQDENWEVSAYVNNLLDEDGVASVVNRSAISILRPREYGLSLSYSF